MRKTILITVLILAALGILGVGVVFAQEEQPPFGQGWKQGGFGPMHTYVIEAFAEKLGLSADEVDDRLDQGESMYQIALAEGIDEDQIASFMTEIHTTAFTNAVADGVLTEEQADWMLQRMQSRFDSGYGLGNCPMHEGANGQFQSGYGPGNGPGYGPGMMGGRFR